MSPVDRAIVERKGEVIRDRLRQLEPAARWSLEEYRADGLRKKGVEKTLQELINAAIDVNYHILSEEGGGIPSDAHGSFTGLAAAGVIPDGLAGSLAPFAGLRNRLVHEYETLDDDKVLAAVASAQALFPRYLEALLAKYGEAD